MALIICSECGKEVSDAAKMCPHCGFRRARPKTRLVIAAMFFAFVLVAIAFSVFREPAVALSPKQEAVVQAIEKVQESLLRPDTFIVYEAYVSEKWSDECLSVYLDFGVENAGGIMLEKVALVVGEDVYYPTSEDESDDLSVDELTGGLYVEIVKAHIAMGAEQWEIVDTEGLV